MKSEVVWRFLPYQVSSPAMNMAIDEAMIQAHSEGKVPPTIRLYGWEPAALSIGYFQQVDKEVDLQKTKQKNIEIVRRLTGGRAVLHDREITYSVVIQLQHPQVPRTVSASHRWISQGLVRALEKLDLPIKSAKPLRKANEKATLACFDTASDYEILLADKKLVGSAQTRQSGVLLQHGSVLLHPHVDQLLSLLYYRTPQLRERMQKKWQQKATSLAEWLQPLPSLEYICDKIYQGFAEGLEVSLQIGKLTSYEQELANHLAKTKYQQDKWTLTRL